jgi:hypothetical protein
MLAVRDPASALRVAWVSCGLLLLNVAGFTLELWQGQELDGFLYRFGMVPSHWLVGSLSDFLGWPWLFLTLLTSQVALRLTMAVM